MAAAVTDAYATPTMYRTQLGKTDTGSDTQIALDLLAVSRYLDRCLGQFFTQDAAVVARYFVPPHALRMPFSPAPLGWAESENPYRYGVWARYLAVDNIATTTGLIIVVDDQRTGLYNETPLATTDYELWPLNAGVGPEPKPWNAIVLPTWSTCAGFPFGVRVKVTAKWGWPAVPQGIINATCQLTAIWRLESPRATSRVNELDQVVSTSDVAQRIVYDLKCKYTDYAKIL